MYQVVYTKYSNERSEEFSLFTKILENEGKQKIVVKIPETQRGWRHIENIKKNYVGLKQIYEKNGIYINKCELNNEGIQLEYLEGKTYEEIVDEILIKNGVDAAIQMMRKYMELVVIKEQLSKFKVTQEFERIFGKVELPVNQMSLSVTDIDMIMSNMICNGGTYYLIDYEWTFDFPIPVKYVIYRIIHYYIECNSIRKKIKKRNIYEKFELTEEEIKCFEQMEQNFQLYIQGDRIPIRDMHHSISPGNFNVQDIIQKKINEKEERKLQVYFSYGEGYREENSKLYSFDDKNVKGWIDVPADVTDIRIDPGTKKGICIIKSLSTEPNDVVIPFSTNGYKISDRLIFFENDDPYFAIVNHDQMEKIYINYEMERVSLELLNELISDCNAYKNKLNNVEINLKDKLEESERYKKEIEKYKNEIKSCIEEKNNLCTQLNEIKWWEIAIGKIINKIVHKISKK